MDTKEILLKLRTKSGFSQDELAEKLFVTLSLIHILRKGRQVSEKKAKAPALLKGWNSKKRVDIDQSSPQKRGVCTCLLYTSRCV